jgi:hypothetical protein
MLTVRSGRRPAEAHQLEGEHEEAPTRHGGLPCDQDSDQSTSPGGTGPWAFGRRIQKLPFPPRFRPPTNIAKYTGEMNPTVWLEDFRHAYQAEGVDDDYFIIQYLPICVREYIRA